ncbi:hypothetical protein RB195_015026 [Necator americanus]|uniref:Uncharacterized protein n=1 Tax=Necator americanus TaxID=51031 RepID=A0ABR1E2P2_NECAM
MFVKEVIAIKDHIIGAEGWVNPAHRRRWIGMGTVVLLRSGLQHLENIEKKLVEKLEEIGPQNVAEVVFTVGRSTQGLYLRIEFLQPNSQISDSSKVETTKTREIGVSCVGEYAEVDLIPITLEISFKAQGDKCDASVQTGTPLQF